METKVCKVCKVEKGHSEFYRKDKYRLEPHCKNCSNIIRVDRERRMREKYIMELPKEKECIECKCVKPIELFYVSSQRRRIIPQCISCFKKNTMVNNDGKFKSDRQSKNKNLKLRERRKLRRKTDNEYRVKTNRKKTERSNRRYHSDPIYRFNQCIRKNIAKYFKNIGSDKPSSTSLILGLSKKNFVEYIEGLFLEGMSWENRNEWHIDHIVPISIGKTIDEIKYLNHHTNLRPLWKNDNIMKGNLIDDSNIELYNKFLKEMRNS